MERALWIAGAGLLGAAMAVENTVCGLALFRTYVRVSTSGRRWMSNATGSTAGKGDSRRVGDVDRSTQPAVFIRIHQGLSTRRRVQCS
jgi:hypothetical protein